MTTLYCSGTLWDVEDEPEHTELEEFNDDDVRCESCHEKIEIGKKLCSYCEAIAEIEKEYPR
ncbi:hypothetical protein K2Q00_02075 [Patescibacteria group bacterium]|nr:hypothetical protein [Patescibacteria group bacterium]